MTVRFPLGSALVALTLLTLLVARSAHADPLTVVAVQYPIEGDHDAARLHAKVERFVRDAKAQGADVVVFPELITFDAWPLKDKRSDEEVTRWMAREITPAFFGHLTALARRHRVAIVGGSSPRLHGDEIRNTALVALADGRTFQQDKVNLTWWEQESGWSPGDTLRPFDAPWGRSVVLICYDVEFPSVSAALVESKPLIWFVPSMTDTVHGLERVRWSAQARAVEHHAFVVVTGTVNTPAKGFENVGQAAFLTPRRATFGGAVVEGERDRPGLVRAVLDVKKLEKSRATARLYPAKDEAKRAAPKVAPAR